MLKGYFSIENKGARLEKKLEKAISSNNKQSAVHCFSRVFVFLLKHKKGSHLSNLVMSYGGEISDISNATNTLSREALSESVDFLVESGHDTAALRVCQLFALDTKAMELMAKDGRANDLAVYMAKNSNDKGLLEKIVLLWEQHNGDIRECPTMSNVLINISKGSEVSVPHISRVKEIIGQFNEAAFLYAKDNDLPSAAMCFEKAGMHKEAFDLYEKIGDGEGVSRMAEALGDLEKALKFAVNPRRKVSLLIRTEKFTEARDLAGGLETPDEYFNLIKEKARARMEARVKAHDFIGGLELADVAECDDCKREEILALGRKHLDRKIMSSSSDVKSIYRDRVSLEEKAGNFEEAARIAEEVLEDMSLASLLYEKANLFNRAISVVSGDDHRSNDKLMRQAELHEKGGNLLSAAKTYESIGEFHKAYTIYKFIQHFHKAIECYLKAPEPRQNTLINLYLQAGEFEKAIDTHMKSGSFKDMEKALIIAKTHNFTDYIKVLEDKIAEQICGSEEDLKAYLKKARNEVINTYCQTFGIDFGTTNSVATIFNKKSKKVEIVPASNGGIVEPSYFGIDDNNSPIVGKPAQLRAMTAPHCVAGRVKRSLGGGGSYSVGGKQYRGEEIAGNILKRLTANLDTYLHSKVEERLYDMLVEHGKRFPEEYLHEFLKDQKASIQIKDVVLSVPAYFNDTEKRATKDAAQICGLRVRRLLHEPTAAALAYGHQKAYSGKIAVIDLGGGTLDISIVDVGEGVYEVEAVGGDTKLGGSDIDSELLRYVINDIKSKLGIDVTQSPYDKELFRLRLACETLKINLSSAKQDTMELVHFLNKPRYTLSLQRSELENIAQPILKRIKDELEKMILGYPSKIEQYILVGNATKMPAVIQLAKEIVKGKHLRNIDPGTVVSQGTALVGAIIEGDLQELLLLDVVPYSLGIAVFDRDSSTEEEKTSKLIEKNSTIPIHKSSIYSTKKDNQPNVNIKIYQGESLHPQENYYLGSFVLDGIRAAPAGTPEIEVTFAIDVDCILTVTAVDKDTGKTQSIRIEDAVSLSPVEKENLRKHFVVNENIQSLKDELKEVRMKISDLQSSSSAKLESAEKGIKEISELFHEKAEANPDLYEAQEFDLDPVHDLAVIKVKSSSTPLEPLNVGEFDFVEPGEQVIAIGFPSPDSGIHSENIYISKGVVNSIRKPADYRERVIFIDANIDQGMSGGPLLNELGEVVGVLRCVLPRYKNEGNEKVFFGSQPVALPIHLIRRYLR